MRRLVDIAVSVVALLLLAPVLAAVAIAVIIGSPGNPFYGGMRIGQGGRRYRMWKFRTMANGAAKLGSITGCNDPRVTTVGQVLRRTKLDELPQFFNVLWGDMTLVGPRPESPDIVDLYTAAQRAVLAVKPGVTGRVQLDSGEEADKIPEEVNARDYYVQHLMNLKILADLDYLRARTARSDTRIVFETAQYVLRCSIANLTRRTRSSLQPQNVWRKDPFA